MATAFGTPLDIANRALQHCGRDRIFSLNDPVPGAREINFVYDKVRRAELRRNVWRFATRRVILRAMDVNTYLLTPAAWDGTRIYMVGALVSFAGLLYLSSVNNNQGTSPDASPASWTLYFGPLALSEWEDPLQSDNSEYWAGDLVYTPQKNPGYFVYLSLSSGNTDTPGVYPAWISNTLYNTGDTVIVRQNLYSDPGFIPVFSDAGNIPVNSDSAGFECQIDMNVNRYPLTDSAAWKQVPILFREDQRYGQNWLQLDSKVRANVVPYPLTAGPVTQLTTRNAFLLPNGFLREAPQDPKSGSGVYLGALGGLPYLDWNYEGNFIVSSSLGPLMLRFVADIADVTAMDDMFCEGLACRIAREVAPMMVPAVERSTRMREIDALYKEIMGEARLVNGIETGAIDPPLDDYLACRF